MTPCYIPLMVIHLIGKHMRHSTNYCLVLFLMLLTSDASAYEESPYDKFAADNNITNKTTVKWITIDGDITKACNKKNRERGLQPFTYKARACSHWSRSIFGDRCEIMTSRSVNYHTLGHELRHCFQGHWPGHP